MIFFQIITFMVLSILSASILVVPLIGFGGIGDSFDSSDFDDFDGAKSLWVGMYFYCTVFKTFLVF